MKNASHLYHSLPDQILPEQDDGQKGAITAEFATTLPAVMLLLAFVIALAAAFSTQLRVSDAARAGARLYAITDNRTQVQQLVHQIAGNGVLVDISVTDQWATVAVSRTLPGIANWVETPIVTARTTVLLERCLPPASCPIA